MQKRSIIKEVMLGDEKQYLIIRGAEDNKPIMLFLHGGPGIPELFTFKDDMSYLEEKFIVIYWEQRGAGKSYKIKDLSLERMILDTLELSRWLCKEYKQENIYLMGHSWGSFLGVLALKREPKLYRAYIGIGQVTNQYKAEKLSLDWLKNKAVKKDIKAISSITLPSKDSSIQEWKKYMKFHRKYLVKYGGSLVDAKGVTFKWIKNLVMMREYSLMEKLHFFSSAFYSFEKLWKDIVKTNLFEEIKSVEVPFYIFQGRYDYQVSYDLAKEFTERLGASKKEFITFENSAHSPNIEEVEKFNKAVLMVLRENEILD